MRKPIRAPGLVRRLVAPGFLGGEGIAGGVVVR